MQEEMRRKRIDNLKVLKQKQLEFEAEEGMKRNVERNMNILKVKEEMGESEAQRFQKIRELEQEILEKQIEFEDEHKAKKEIIRELEETVM